MFTEDMVKGVRKELEAATISAEIFVALSTAVSFISTILITFFSAFPAAAIWTYYADAVTIRA